MARGEALTLGGTDPENPGWRWCVNEKGLGGWLPEGWVVDGRAKGAFDTTEATVAPGTRVTLVRAHAGWWFCRLGDGRHGWLPESVLSIGD
ncbi:hypothetical protein roselon_01741 [Roseibacterium elongatum DSM 19469]|uniref:SH3 domain-containing protein n=1 Tax=Roseicyclus elongatus DSM 19469 TaxID=1294273 RepID=W8RSK7_9RHOB|nr:hypothetical protein [Roseibacterium elongatum]AHM04108.1 hypothetical protein roselon_01741 [Roseibacterium elongatum DSM 19469]